MATVTTRGRRTSARLTADDFLRSGLQLLAELGPDDLTIAALCDRLAVTKGSFYHHFSGLPDYVTRLLAYWEKDYNAELIARAQEQDNPLYAVPLLTESAVTLPHATEAALRAWGRSNVEVARAMARVDAARIATIEGVLISGGVDKPTARLIAELGVTVLIGFQHHENVGDVARLRDMFDQVNRLVYLEMSAEG